MFLKWNLVASTCRRCVFSHNKSALNNANLIPLEIYFVPFDNYPGSQHFYAKNVIGDSIYERKFISNLSMESPAKLKLVKNQFKFANFNDLENFFMTNIMFAELHQVYHYNPTKFSCLYLELNVCLAYISPLRPYSWLLNTG